MEIYTIGFTKTTAVAFFESLRRHGIDRVVDVRLNNTSQLSGFAKRDDLAYFLKELVGAEYVHETQLAPTQELLKQYRDGELKWNEYEPAFVELITERRIADTIPRTLFSERTALLCSEATPEHCHRRLIVEYLDRAWGGVTSVDL